MVRHLLFGIGLALSALAGYFAYAQLPQFIDLMTPGILGQDVVLMFRDNPFMAAAGYASLGGISVFILVFVSLTIWDSVAIVKVRRELEGLRDRQLDGQAPTTDDLVTAFAEAPEFSAHAAAFAATLESVADEDEAEEGATFLLRSSVPPHVFLGQHALVERNLYLWFFRSLPILLVGIGAFALAGTVIVDLHGLMDGRTTVGEAQLRLLAATRTGLIALTMAGFSAFLIAILTRIALGARVAQANRITDLLSVLFPGGAEARQLADVALASRTSAQDLSASIAKLGNKIHQDITKQAQKVLQATEAESDALATKLGQAVEATLSKPIAKLTSATKTLTQDQSDRVKKLLDAVLATFVAELEKSFGGQTREIQKLLKSSVTTVEKAEKTFGQVIKDLGTHSKEQLAALAGQIEKTLQDLREGEAEQFNQLSAELASYTENLRDQVDSHSHRFETLLEEMLKESSEIAKTVLTQSASDIARTAESFDTLHAGLQNMMTLAMPILNQVIGNQESLLMSLESDASASKSIGRASSEMSAAAQASRETVERFITLAERMREVSNALRAAASGERLEMPARPGMPRGSKRLSEAVQELRNVARETAEDLPQLGDD